MRTSETTKEIFSKLFSIQGEIQKAPMSGENPHFKSEYTTIQDLFDLLKPMLQPRKMFFIQSPAQGEISGVRSLRMITRIIDTESGEWVEGSLEVELKEAGPQALGSAITYLRRYQLSSMLGVVSDDDDGNAATTKTSPKSSYVPKASTPTTPPPAKPAPAPVQPTKPSDDPPMTPGPEERAIIQMNECRTPGGLIKCNQMLTANQRTKSVQDHFNKRLSELKLAKANG